MTTEGDDSGGWPFDHSAEGEEESVAEGETEESGEDTPEHSDGAERKVGDINEVGGEDEPGNQLELTNREPRDIWVVGVVSTTSFFLIYLLIIGIGTLFPADINPLDWVPDAFFFYSIVGLIYGTPIVSSLCLYVDSRRIDSPRLITYSGAPIMFHILALLVFVFFGLIAIQYGDQSGAGGGGIAVGVLGLAIVLLIISTLLSWVYVVKRRKVLRRRG